MRPETRRVLAEKYGPPRFTFPPPPDLAALRGYTPSNQLNPARTADLIFALETTARQHGFLLERKITASGSDEITSFTVRIIQAHETSVQPSASPDLIRRQIEHVVSEALKTPTL